METDNTERIECSEAELIAALLDTASGGTIDLRRGATAAEIAKVKDWSLLKTRGWIRYLLECGELEPTRVIRQAMDGRMTPVSAYRTKK